VDSLLGIPAGLALSTAAGVRVFVPLLLTSAAARFGYITLAPGTTWIGSDAALIVLQIALARRVSRPRGRRRTRAA
jgi:predicted small integral membrane protein